jgi:hypothetical protein
MRGARIHAVVAGFAVVAVLAVSCSSQTQAGRPPSTSPTESCVELWGDVYESSIRSGVSEGEARRLADSARAECEGLGNTVPSIEPGPSVACAGDADRRNALPVSDEPKMVSVYFSCQADFAFLGTTQQPLYMFTREIPLSLSDTTGHRLEGAMRHYLAGPRPQEVDRGYFSAAAAPMADALAKVSLNGGEAIVDFDESIEGRLGNLGTATASSVFLLEVQATAFQFPAVESLTITMEGDCDRFWRMLEMECQKIGRP